MIIVLVLSIIVSTFAFSTENSDGDQSKKPVIKGRFSKKQVNQVIGNRKDSESIKVGELKKILTGQNIEITVNSHAIDKIARCAAQKISARFVDEGKLKNLLLEKARKFERKYDDPKEQEVEFLKKRLFYRACFSDLQIGLFTAKIASSSNNVLKVDLPTSKLTKALAVGESTFELVGSVLAPAKLGIGVFSLGKYITTKKDKKKYNAKLKRISTYTYTLDHSYEIASKLCEELTEQNLGKINSWDNTNIIIREAQYAREEVFNHLASVEFHNELNESLEDYSSLSENKKEMNEIDELVLLLRDKISDNLYDAKNDERPTRLITWKKGRFGGKTKTPGVLYGSKEENPEAEASIENLKAKLKNGDASAVKFYRSEWANYFTDLSGIIAGFYESSSAPSLYEF